MVEGLEYPVDLFGQALGSLFGGDSLGWGIDKNVAVTGRLLTEGLQSFFSQLFSLLALRRG
jgi:hypothetical protein